MLRSRIIKVLFLVPLAVLLSVAIVQQVRFPDSGAWIVSAIAAGYLLLALVVWRLWGR